MAMPMNSDAREPSANRMMTATRRTPVATEFCRSLSICLMTLDLSWVKDTCTALGQVSFSFSTTCFTPSTVSIRLAPVRLEISIVMAGRPFTRVTVVASLNVGRTCEMSPSVTVAPGRGNDGDTQHVLRLFNQRRDLDGKAPGLAFQGPGGHQAVGGLGHGGELIERHAIALHQHGLGDDFHHLVARAAQFRREHARHLLERVLGRPRDAEQAALRHVARERDHQHRVKREIDLLHDRLVHVSREIALGIVDLGAHIRERGLGIEAGFEFEQHIAAALEGGGAHFLDVGDGFQLGFDRPQQEPLGIFRADAALGELHIDDRNLDVRLGLLRDRHIGDEAGEQQEGQQSDREARVADRVIDKFRHLSSPRLGDLAAGRRARRHRQDLLAFAHEILALHDDARAGGDAADPHVGLIVLDHRNGNELHRVGRIHGANAQAAAGGKSERGTRNAGRRLRLHA